MFAPALGQPFMDGVYWSIVLELVFYGWVTLALISGAFQRFKLELVTGWLAVIALNEIVLGSGALRMAVHHGVRPALCRWHPSSPHQDPWPFR